MVLNCQIELKKKKIQLTKNKIFNRTICTAALPIGTIGAADGGTHKQN